MRKGGHLASAHSQEDSDAIKAAISATSASTAWIGFHDRDQEAGCTSTDRGQGAGQRTGQGEVRFIFLHFLRFHFPTHNAYPIL